MVFLICGRWLSRDSIGLPERTYRGLLRAKFREEVVINEELMGFPGGPVVKNPPANAGDTGSIPAPGSCHVGPCATTTEPAHRACAPQQEKEIEKVKSLSPVWLFVTPWTVAYQVPLSVGFSRQEYWSGLPCPSPGDLPDTGIEPRSPVLQADALPSELPEKPNKRSHSKEEPPQWEAQASEPEEQPPTCCN